MNLSNYSNRELVKELTSRNDFLGCVLHYSRPVGVPVQDESQAMIVLSKHMNNPKALSLLKAAIRAMERAATDSASSTSDKRIDSPKTVPTGPNLEHDTSKVVSIRPDL